MVGIGGEGMIVIGVEGGVYVVQNLGSYPSVSLMLFCPCSYYVLL